MSFDIDPRMDNTKPDPYVGGQIEDTGFWYDPVNKIRLNVRHPEFERLHRMYPDLLPVDPEILENP